MRDMIELNVLGALLCAKAAIPRMSKKHGGQGGAMVLISSMAAVLGSPGRICLVRGLEGRGRLHDHRAVEGACRRRHPRQRACRPG